jgi:hypothetical protein
MMKLPLRPFPIALFIVAIVFGLGLLGLVAAWASPLGGVAVFRQSEVVVKWNKPDIAPKWLAEQHRLDLVEAKIQKVLNEEIYLDVDGLSIARIFKLLRGKFDIPIVLDGKAFEAKEVSPDQIANLPRMRTSVRILLLHVLRPHNLTYVVESDALRITDAAGANLVRHYDLSHVFPDNALFQELIETVKIMISRYEWQNDGGTNSISLIGSTLVIRAPAEVQMEVSKILFSIGQQPNSNMKPREFDF